MNKQYNCSFCGKIFDRYIRLYNHKRRSQKCIKLQQQFDENINEEFCFDCDKVIFANEEHICLIPETNDKNNNNVNIIANNINIINNGNIYIKNIKTSNTYIIENFIPLEIGFLNRQARQHFSEEHTLNLLQGILDYSLYYPLKENIICCNSSRNIVKYLDKNSNIFIDKNLNHLGPLLFQSIRELNAKYIKNIIVENTLSISKIQKITKIHNDIIDASYGNMLSNNTFKKWRKYVSNFIPK